MVYGIFSFLVYLRLRKLNLCKYPLQIWIKAFNYSLFSSFGYYLFVVLSSRYASPAVCALILGISPITIAFYGNWKQKECSFRSLTMPSIFIFAGLVMINIFPILKSDSPSNYLLGLLYGFTCLGTWTWYVIANGRFLKSHPEVKSNDWATLIGIATFFWAIVFSVGICLFDPQSMEKFYTFSKPLWNFVIGCSILGLACSWVGTFFWNKASFVLPLSLVGQLSIFETIFGLVYVYILEQNLPSVFEALGILMLLIAVFFGIRTFSKTPALKSKFDL